MSEQVTISKKDYEELLYNTILMNLYRNACDQSDYPKHLHQCSAPGCEALCLRDSRDYDGYYNCESMETCDKCDANFCNLHLDQFDEESNLCKNCYYNLCYDSL